MFIAQVLDRRLTRSYQRVSWPVEEASAVLRIICGVESPVFLTGEERPVRVERLYVQQLVVLASVPLDEVETSAHGARPGEVRPGYDLRAIDPILLQHRAGVRPNAIGDGGLRHLVVPWVVLLATEKLSGVVLGKLVAAAVLKIAIMVSREVPVDTGRLQQLRHRAVVRLKRTPNRWRKVGRPMCMSWRGGMHGTKQTQL